ncbi:MAG: hypothetical protein J0I36_00870, partial [Pandoraea sp.]|nr:hypothetical protein [Pandoraea sp.]
RAGLHCRRPRFSVLSEDPIGQRRRVFSLRRVAIDRSPLYRTMTAFCRISTSLSPGDRLF